MIVVLNASGGKDRDTRSVKTAEDEFSMSKM